MFKFLSSGCLRKARPLFSPSHCMNVKKNAALVRVFPLSNAKENLYTTCAYKFPFPFPSSKRNTRPHLAQIAWKRISLAVSNSGAATSMFACATLLALIKFSLVAPTMHSLPRRELGFSQRVWAGDHAECLRSGHSHLALFVDPILKKIFAVMRTIQLAILFSPIIAMAPFLDYFDVKRREIWIHLLRATLEKAGPAFIAWGQWAATRPDLFPRDLCAELSNLNSKTREHSFACTKKTIEKAFGRKLPEIFDKFDEAPIESGHVAQVHRATLRSRYPGKQTDPIMVDVKVRHPGVIESFDTDFVVIQCATKLLSHISSLKWLKLNERTRQFEDFISSQLDLSAQAMILARFTNIFSGWKDVSSAKPVYPLVHPTVLVKMHEEGESVLHYIDDDDFELGRRTKGNLVHAGTRALLSMFMGHKLIHTSTDPTNIIVRVKDGKPHVSFLDVGIAAEVSSRNIQDNIPRLVRACGTRDGRIAAESALQLSKEQSCPYPDAFVEDIEKSFDFWDTEEGGKVTPLECMHRLIEKARCHKVNIDDEACTVLVSIMNIEDWQRKLYLESQYRLMQTFHCFVPKTSYPHFGSQWRSERGRRTYNVLD